MSVAAFNPETSAEKPRLSHEEAMHRARVLAPALRERAATTEAERRIADETMEAIAGAGLLRILMPRRWCGYEISHDAAFDVSVEIATACGSTGWCVSLLNIHDWWLAGFPEEAQHYVWGDTPDRIVCAMVYPTGNAAPVDGGYRLSGRWSFVSGVDCSHWAIVAAMVSGLDGPPHARHFLIPRADYAIEDTWHNVGMRGTGSNDLIVGDVFVPAHRTISMDDFREGTTPGSRVNAGPLYRGAAICIFAHALAAPALGVARGALADWIEGTRGKAATTTGEAVAEWSHVQIGAAQTQLDIDVGEMLLRRNLASIRNGGPTDRGMRARGAASYGHAVRILCTAIDKLVQMSGARGMRDESTIQRAWRDIHAISAHVGLNADLSGQSFGRFLFGLPRDPKVRMY